MPTLKLLPREPRTQPMPGDPHVALEPAAADELEDKSAVVAPVLETGGLKLDQPGIDRLVQLALERIDELRSEMGIEVGGSTGSTGWAWEREKNQLQYDNSWDWRNAADTIFEYSNFSPNIAKRFARLIAARTSDDLIGTDPFFSCMPTEHGGDAELAKQAESYVQDQLSNSNARAAIKEAQKVALIRNEAVVKITFVNNETHFVGPGIVAVGPFQYRADPTPDNPTGIFNFAAGDPVVTPRGKYIYEKDDVFEDPNVQGLFRLKKEAKVAFTTAFQFQYFEDLDQTLEGYEGIDLRTLDYRDFLCPLKVASIHEADICVHLFDEQWERMKARFKNFAISEAYQKAEYMAGEKQPKLEKGEQESGSKILRIGNYADVYMRCNPYEGTPDDPGRDSEVWMVIDLNSKKLVWADFLGNHMKRRPFEVIPGVEKVQNRWYGTGVFEMLAHKQLYIDTQFNRVNWKSSKSSNVRFRVKNAVDEWKNGEQMEFGTDTVYNVNNPLFNAQNPPLFSVQLTDIDEYAMKLLELMIQAGSTEIGIVGPDDGAMAGLETTKLAEGIRSLERTGNLLLKFTETDHAEGISAILDQCVDIILERMDENEVIYDPESQALYQINRDEIRRLRKSVRLLLTRSRSTETIQTARMVIQLCREYYEAITPYEQFKLRGEYVRQLKALETPDADTLLKEVTKEEADAWLEAQKTAPPPLPPKTSIAAKWGDLERSEQEQVLRREGIEPAKFDEVIAARNEEAKLEVKKEGAIAKAKEDAKPDPAPPKKK
jgi:hypothetical protein